jgi:hypothetical protein
MEDIQVFLCFNNEQPSKFFYTTVKKQEILQSFKFWEMVEAIDVSLGAQWTAYFYY